MEVFVVGVVYGAILYRKRCRVGIITKVATLPPELFKKIISMDCG